MAKGKTLLLTRPAAQSRAFAKDIAARFPDTRTIISPLIGITFDGTLPDLSGFDALVFTSANGVRAFRAAGGETTLPAFCVGPHTTAEARAAGLEARSADGDVIATSRLLYDSLPEGARVLHICGEHVAGTLAPEGITVQRAPLYRQPALPLTVGAQAALSEGAVDAVLLFSPRSAEILGTALQQNPHWPRESLRPLCLSPNVAGKLQNTGLPAAMIAKAPNRDEMLALIGEFLG